MDTDERRCEVNPKETGQRLLHKTNGRCFRAQNKHLSPEIPFSVLSLFPMLSGINILRFSPPAPHDGTRKIICCEN